MWKADMGEEHGGGAASESRPALFSYQMTAASLPSRFSALEVPQAPNVDENKY